MGGQLVIDPGGPTGPVGPVALRTCVEEPSAQMTGQQEVVAVAPTGAPAAPGQGGSQLTVGPVAPAAPM
jgi:hypothetical protein